MKTIELTLSIDYSDHTHLYPDLTFKTLIESSVQGGNPVVSVSGPEDSVNQFLTDMTS